MIGQSQPASGSTGETNGRFGARSGTAAAGASESLSPGAASFRANWQAQLDALEGGKGDLGTDEERLDGSPENSAQAAAPNQREATQALTADKALPPWLAGTQTGAQSGASAVNIRNGASVTRAAGILSARTGKQAAESAEAGGPARTKSKQSAEASPAKPVAKSQSSTIAGTANPLETATAIAAGPALAMGNPIAALVQALDQRSSSMDNSKPSIIGHGSMSDDGPDQARSTSANSVDRAAVAGKIEAAGTQPEPRNEMTAAHAPEEQGSAPATAPGQDADLTASQSQRASQQASLETLEPNQAAPLPLAIQANDQSMPLGQGEALATNPLPSSASGKATSGLAGGSTVAASVVAVRPTSQRPGAAGDRSIPTVGQSANPFGEAASMFRDPSSAREPATSSAGGAGPEPALRETFAALDADVAPGGLTWTHASARQAEAGFEDPALGWIGVRAESNGVGVHASLVPGSDAAAQELGTHMEGLNAYLAEHHTPLESLAMAAPEGRGAGHGGEPGSNQGSSQSANQGSNQGAGQNPPQQGNSEPESISAVLMPGRMPGVDRSVSAAVAVGQGASTPVSITAGAHISVMA